MTFWRTTFCHYRSINGIRWNLFLSKIVRTYYHYVTYDLNFKNNIIKNRNRSDINRCEGNNYFSPSDPSESSSLSSYSPPIALAFRIFWRLTFVGFCGSAISHFNSIALLSVSVASSNAVLPSLFIASKSTFLAASFWSIWITAACPKIEYFRFLF